MVIKPVYFKHRFYSLSGSSLGVLLSWHFHCLVPLRNDKRPWTTKLGDELHGQRQWWSQKWRVFRIPNPLRMEWIAGQFFVDIFGDYTGGGCQLIRLFMHSTRRRVFCSSPPQNGQSRGHQTARGQWWCGHTHDMTCTITIRSTNTLWITTKWQSTTTCWVVGGWGRQFTHEMIRVAAYAYERRKAYDGVYRVNHVRIYRDNKNRERFVASQLNLQLLFKGVRGWRYKWIELRWAYCGQK